MVGFIFIGFYAPVAQLDRVADSGSVGQFQRHIPLVFNTVAAFLRMNYLRFAHVICPVV